FHLHRLATNAVLERRAFQIFHHDESLAVFFADVVNRANVRVIQSGGGFGFAAETAEGLGVAGNIVGQKFQRDKTIQAGVLRFIDDTHASAAELFDDAVMGDGFAEKGCGFHHFALILGSVRSQSKSTTEHRELFSYGLNKRIDGVDAIDQRLIETDFGEINAELFFEENNDLDGIYRSEASADQQRSVV